MTVEAYARQIAMVSDTPGWMQGLVATLPRSLRGSGNLSTADLVLIDGQGDWPARISRALAQGARNLVLAEPCYTEVVAVSSVIDAINDAGANCTIIEALPDNPAIEGFRDFLSAGFGELVVTASGPVSLAGMALAQIRLLRALKCHELTCENSAVLAQAFVTDGTAKIGDTFIRLRLSGTAAPSPARLDASAFSGSATARLAWTGGTEASPVDASLADAAGLRVMPALHEGGLRLGLRTILRNTGSSPGSGALRDFANDLKVANTILTAP